MTHTQERRAAQSFVMLCDAMPDLSPAKLKTLMAVFRASYAEGDAPVPMSADMLEAETGLSRPAVVAAAKKLEADGLIERRSQGHKKPFTYRINVAAFERFGVQEPRGK